MKDLFIKGNLHIPAGNLWHSPLYDDGITIYVKGDVFFHTIDDDFIFSKDDMCIENAFEKYHIKDIIAYSAHEKLK